MFLLRGTIQASLCYTSYFNRLYFRQICWGNVVNRFELIIFSSRLLQIMDDMVQKREQQLRQYSFFQLRIHLKRGQNLVAMDKNGQWLTADGSMTTFIATADTQIKTPKTHQTHPHDTRTRATHEPFLTNDSTRTAQNNSLNYVWLWRLTEQTWPGFTLCCTIVLQGVL